MSSGYRSTVWASCFIQFVATLSINFVNAFLTLFLYQDIGVPTLGEAALWSGIGAFIAGSCLAVSAPFWGYLTDRVGPRWMMVRVLASHSLLTALMALAGSVQVVLLLRGLRGLLGGTSIVAISAIASTTKGKELPGALGYQHSAQILGGMIGPIFGGLAAPVIGFRACFLVSSLAIASAIPLVFLMTWPEGKGKETPKQSLRILKGMRKELAAMLVARTSMNFLNPILPVYLKSAGVEDGQLTRYTGIVLTLSRLALALSVPLTSRKVSRGKMPHIFALQSLAILGQGLMITLPSFVALRTTQVVIHSPVSAQLFSVASETRREKGVAVGFMSSAKFLGGAISPVLASTANYLVGLTFAFGCMSAVSLLAALATWRLLSGKEPPSTAGGEEGYLEQREAE
jgi:MFS family permease